MDLVVLHHVRNAHILFHNGLWGSEMCYMWASAEPGRGCGRVGGNETDALDRLARRGLVAIQPGQGATDVPVVLTSAGRDHLLAETGVSALART
jgi:hypothetical protein